MANNDGPHVRGLQAARGRDEVAARERDCGWSCSSRMYLRRASRALVWRWHGGKSGCTGAGSFAQAYDGAARTWQRHCAGMGDAVRRVPGSQSRRRGTGGGGAEMETQLLNEQGKLAFTLGLLAGAVDERVWQRQWRWHGGARINRDDGPTWSAPFLFLPRRPFPPLARRCSHISSLRYVNAFLAPLRSRRGASPDQRVKTLNVFGRVQTAVSAQLVIEQRGWGARQTPGLVLQARSSRNFHFTWIPWNQSGLWERSGGMRNGNGLKWTVWELHHKRGIIGPGQTALGPPAVPREHTELVVGQQPAWPNHQPPLSREATHETYVSSYKYVSNATKVLILTELRDRTIFERNARAVADDSCLIQEIVQLLESPDARVREFSCYLVGTLASHESTFPMILELDLSGRLVSLVQDKADNVRHRAVSVLCNVAHWADGAEAIYAAHGAPPSRMGVMDHYEVGGDAISSGGPVEINTLYTTGVPPAASLDLFFFVDTLLIETSDEHVDIVAHAIYTLSQVSRSSGGAEATQSAGVLEYMPELLDSPSLAVRKWACWLLAHLAHHVSTAPAVWDPEICARLVTLLRRSLAGVQIAVEMQVVNYITELLTSSKRDVRRCACVLVENLASYEATAQAILGVEPYMQLVSLLRDESGYVLQKAIHAAQQITRWPAGARGLVDAQVVDCLAGLLESSATEVQTSRLVKNLVSHGAIAPDALELKLSERHAMILD
ncbi:armadillo-type protein [Mycena latifolia]|nr:armadillo-type protein [Mycena latifolia]